MADLIHLKNVRAGHKSVLTKKLRDLEDALKTTPPYKDTLEQFKVSLQEKLDVLKNLSDQIVAKLQDVTEIATEIEGHEATTDSVCSALPKINRILGPAPAAVASPAPGANKIKLPKLSIAPFEASYVKWLTFWDSYESAVHNNPELSDVNKFTYLQSLLRKEAKDSIAGLALTSANYQAAIEILKKRFGDSAQNTAKHMEELIRKALAFLCRVELA